MTAPLSPSDRAEIEAVVGDLALPYCVPALRAGIRHLARNCQVDCPEHGDDFDGLCREPGRYDGEALARVLNAVPALLAWGKRAEDAVARVREVCAIYDAPKAPAAGWPIPSARILAALDGES